jgi:hypothetical protein
MMHIYPATFCTAFGYPVLVWVTLGEWAKQGAIAFAAPVSDPSKHYRAFDRWTVSSASSWHFRGAHARGRQFVQALLEESHDLKNG